MTDFITLPEAPEVTVSTWAELNAFVKAHRAEMQKAGKQAKIVIVTGHGERDFPKHRLTNLAALTGPLPEGYLDSEQGARDPMWFWNPKVAALLIDMLAERLIQEKVTLLKTGMAGGWGIIGPPAAIKAGIPYVALLPFESQPCLWPELQRKVWAKYVKQAALVAVITPVRTIQRPGARKVTDLDREKMRKAMMDRNLALLYGADECWSLDKGKRSGETRDCVDAADKMGIPVYNFWTQFEQMVRGAGVLSLQHDHLGKRAHYWRLDDQEKFHVNFIRVSNQCASTLTRQMERVHRLIKGLPLDDGRSTPPVSDPLIADLSF